MVSLLGGCLLGIELLHVAISLGHAVIAVVEVTVGRGGSGGRGGGLGSAVLTLGLTGLRGLLLGRAHGLLLVLLLALGGLGLLLSPSALGLLLGRLLGSLARLLLLLLRGLLLGHTPLMLLLRNGRGGVGLCFTFTVALCFAAFLALFANLEPSMALIASVASMALIASVFGDLEAVHGLDSLGSGLGGVIIHETKTTVTAIGLAFDTRADDVTERFEMLIQLMIGPVVKRHNKEACGRMAVVAAVIAATMLMGIKNGLN